MNNNKVLNKLPLYLSIFFSFTLLPLAVIMSILEPISSGDSGGEWIFILIFCIIPGLVWAVLNKVGGIRRKKYLILFSFQVVAMIFSAVIAPYTPDIRNEVSDKRSQVSPDENSQEGMGSLKKDLGL